VFWKFLFYIVNFNYYLFRKKIENRLCKRNKSQYNQKYGGVEELKRLINFSLIVVLLVMFGIAPISENNHSSIFSAGIALAAQNCPSCGGLMYFTGQTKTEWGNLFKLYKCPVGHLWWIKQQTSSEGFWHFSNKLKCPVCGATVYFTGQTYIEWGKLFKVYKCPAGHRSVSQK
jgi:predicted nucleic-acid-binding Zn-ribbon protein